MSVLTTKIKLVDDMTEKLKNLGTNGRDVEEQLKSIGTTASSLEKISEEAEKSTQAFAETSNAVQEYNEWHEQSVDALSNYINGVEGSEEELNKYIGTTENSSEATEKFNEKLKGSQKEHQETQKQTQKTTDETEKYGKTNKEVFGELEGLIASAGVVVFLKQAYDGYVKCIEAASSFETSMAKVSTLANPDVMSIGAMSDDILELSSKTGQAATELAEAEYQALSAGVAQKSAAEFVEKANQLAVGGFTEAATSVDVLTTALNAYQMDVSETNRVSDTLIMTQNLGKTTVDELAQNMGRVIPSAAAYNIQIEDLSTAYALLTANGIATAESTTYLKGMFNELGDTGSTVSTTLQEETGKSFATLIEDGSSLGDIIGVLSDSVNGNATSFANLWSSQEAGIGALSLLTSGTEKYNSTLEKMKNSTGTASEAYEKMTNTSEHTAKAVQTAGTNFQIAVGNAMLPATNKFNEAIAGVLNGLTTFVNENPVVVKVLAAGTAGFAAATIAITLYSAKTKIAEITTLAFAAAQKALQGPVGIGIGLLTAGVTALTAWAMSQDDAAEQAKELTTASKEQEAALNEANAKYEAAKEKYGETSPLVDEYRNKVDELTTSFNNNRETLGDLIITNEELKNKYQELKSSDKSEEINNEADAAKSLSDRLFVLAGRTNLTKGEHAEMLGIIEQLNKVFPELGLNYDSVISEAANTKEALMEIVNQEYDNKQFENAKQSYWDSVELLEEQKEAFNKMNAEMKDPYEKYINSNGNMQAQAEWDDFWNKQKTTTDESGNEIKKTWGEVYEESAERLEELQNKVNGYADAMAEAKGITEETAGSQLTAQDAAVQAATSIDSQLQQLAISYEDAYNSALESFQNQYALWDEAPKIVETSTTETNEILATSASTLIKNLDTQISYWDSYNSNLESLQERNIKGLDEVLKRMDDGSEESAAALAGMANASDSELQKIVDKHTKLQEEQKNTATTVGELEADFKEKMGSMEDCVKKTIENMIVNMNLSEEATKSANDTMNAYISAIKDKQGLVDGAIADVISSAKQKFNLGTFTINTTVPVKGYARGTTHAEDIFIAGEEGPELIVGHAGATVYTAEETEQIINHSFNIPDTSVWSGIAPVSAVEPENRLNAASSEKVVTLKLEGLGAIQISGSGGIRKNEIVDILTEQIKPVLISVLNDEIYEEGDDSYEY